MDKLIVTIAGLAGIAGIYWFFFGKNDRPSEAKTVWTVRVSGGYQPGTVVIPKNTPATVTFIRDDPNSCLEEIVIDALKVKRYLPIGKPVTIIIPSRKSGTLEMHCGMNMFHGSIKVS